VAVTATGPLAGWLHLKGREFVILDRTSKYSIKIETLEDMETHRSTPGSELDWNCLFVLPFWLQAVCRHIGCRGEPYILSVHDGSRVVGIAPLSIEDHTASFLGNPNVCDYQDIVVIPGYEALVMAAVASHLKARGVRRMELQTLRPEAAALRALQAMTPREIHVVSVESEGVTYETGLPAAWDDFLMQLSGKQRHEVRRKMRRLESHGAFAYKTAGIDDQLDSAMGHFLRLFHMNRTDKAEFMDAAMADYFRELIEAADRHRILKLHVLEVEQIPVAAVLCFDYGQERYLYNSAYDAHYHELSVGIVSKLLSIRAGIEAGCRRYDFLKGAERYKKHLGGSEVPLYQCTVTL
jgi:CelD/BcsL family acetyltransferase involved in cellulose biosynthesis